MSEHTKDEDCTLDDTGICTVCGTYHGDPCEFCGKRGFHADNCPGPELEDQKMWGEPEPEPEIDDSVHFCPECERPNQFGELCMECEREMALHD